MENKPNETPRHFNADEYEKAALNAIEAYLAGVTSPTEEIVMLIHLIREAAQLANINNPDSSIEFERSFDDSYIEFVSHLETIAKRVFEFEVTDINVPILKAPKKAAKTVRETA